MDCPMWPELPPDVLREISRRLDDAGNFVHFHAVCKPWRDSHEPMRTRRKQWVHPWLLAPYKKKIPFKLRCVFSRTSYGALPPLSVRRRHRRNWVAIADGTAVWYLDERHSPSPSLRDALTGAVALLLPPFSHENRRWEGPPSGVVYNDGTVLLRSITVHDDTTKFRAALLRPSDATWMIVERTFRSPDLTVVYVSYYHGKILITVDGPTMTPDDEAGNGGILAVTRPWMPCKQDDYFYVQSYTLESCGELLCVSIYLNLVRALSVAVHTLEEGALAPGKMHWVRRDGRSLADRVLFLGWPNSFAVDASVFSGDDTVSSGCAYFVYRDFGVMPNQPCHVFRYNLMEDKSKFVERLPQGWNKHMYMWIFPQPSIAPTEEIIDQLESRKWWKKKKKPHMDPTPRSNIYIETPQPQCYNTNVRVSVHNLPPKVDSFQLCQFFNKHGKVSNAKVVFKGTTKMPKKIGLVTIAMVEERADALSALNGLVFNGCTIEVRLVRKWKGRNVPPARSNQHSRGRRGYLLCIVLLLFLFVLIVWWKLI